MRAAQPAELTALVVDDEAPARRALRLRLEREPDISVVGEASSGAEAVEAIERWRPNLVFLDIQMPGMDGFEVLRNVDPSSFGEVVFVTAYARHAVEAFEVEALDYILKPFDKERFQAALGRARQRLEKAPKPARDGQPDVLSREVGSALLERLKSEPPRRIRVREGSRERFVELDQVDWIEADGNYVRLHVGEREHLVRETLTEISRSLEPAGFIRIHRSHAVNFDRVVELRPVEHGEWAAVLESGAQLRISRGYKDRVFRRFL